MARTYRKTYRGPRRFSRDCRNGGSCDYCRANRLHNARRREVAANDRRRDYELGREVRVEIAQ